jgi:hypothetical protein
MSERRRSPASVHVRHIPRSTRWACLSLICIIAIAMLFADRRAKEIPEIRRLRTLVASQGIPCNSSHYWWSDPKGRWTLSCSEFEIDAFNNPAEVATFITRYTAPRQADLLRRFGASSYLVRGRRWLLITPNSRTASIAAGATGGRKIVVSTSGSSH